MWRHCRRRTDWDDQPLVRGEQVSAPCSNKKLSGQHNTRLVLVITPGPFHLRTHYKSLGARHTVSLLPYLFGLPGNRSHHIQASRLQPFPEHSILPEKPMCNADGNDNTTNGNASCRPLFPTLTIASTVTIYIYTLHYPFEIIFPMRFASDFS